jgi:hypothetical protein
LLWWKWDEVDDKEDSERRSGNGEENNDGYGSDDKM